MSNKGFETSPAAIISLIRDNLHDRYAKGFPIIKEILQNADDATKATCLHFGWCPGFLDDPHPLLRGPAVFFVNDGAFTGPDERAIRQFGQGYKAAERASIGKFGLGLKSVFHLCEAFFYLWYPPHNEVGAAVSGNILNPWSGLCHATWDEVSDSTLQTIRDFLSSLLTEKNWFVLWVPLRRKAALEGIAPIIEAYPGDQLEPPNLDAVFCEELASQLARVLPQLHHVRTVNAWMARDGELCPKRQFSVALTPGSSQRCFPDTLPETGSAPLFGQIETTFHHAEAVSYAPPTYTYTGFEALARDPDLLSLIDSGYWPKGVSLNPGTTDWITSPEKAVPHGLVTFVSKHSAPQQGRLTISWAVFLPVNDGNEAHPLECGMDVQLTLHGYFFLDAGRQRIEGIVDGEPSEIADEMNLRRTWNVRLRRLAVLPLLLPALASWVRDTGVPEAAALAVTKCLLQSDLHKTHRGEIAKDVQWVRRVLQSGIQWENVPATVRILEVPAPPQADPGRPFTVFPALAQIAETHALIHRDTPFLAANGPANWTDEHIVNLVTSVPAEVVFASRTYLPYFADAIDTFGVKKHPDALNAVRIVLRTAFRTVPLSDLRGVAAALTKVIRLLPEEWCFLIPKAMPDEVHAFVAGLNLDAIPVSEHFSEDKGTLSQKDLDRILQAFAQPPDVLKQRPDWPKVCSDFVVHAIEVYGDWDFIRTPPYNQYKLFRVKDCARGSDVLESATAIAQAFEGGTAFAFGQPPAPEGLAQVLQQALQSLRILLIPAEIYRRVLGEERHICDAAACVGVLENKPALRGPRQRAAPLDELLKANLSLKEPQPKRALRYLLHGSPEHYDDSHSLVAAHEANEESVWTKLVRLVATPWRYVPRELANVLNPEHRRALAITAITPEGTVRILRESKESLRALNLSVLSATEREQLLEQIDDPDVLKRLPIHETLSGQLISVGPNTYLDAGVRPGTALGAQIQIVGRLQTNRLATIQEELLDLLTPVKLLELALGQENPVLYWEDIAGALKETRAQELGPSTERLRTQAWMPLTRGGAVAPKAILEITGLDQTLGQLVFPDDGGCIPAHVALRACWEHPGVQRHKDRLLPPFQDRLEMFGEVLAGQQTEDYRCGLSSLEEVRLQEFVDLFAGRGVMPVADIVQMILAKDPKASGQICQYLLPHLAQPPSTDRIVHALTHVANGHMQAAREEKDRWKHWHDLYLEVARQSSSLSEILPQIKLRNRAGRWKATTELCVRAENICDEDLLETHQAELLGLAAVHANPEETLLPACQPDTHVDIDDDAFVSSAQTLRTYFSPWRARVPEELVGAFLTFLGDHADIRKLAQEYLGQRSIETTRALLPWDTMMGVGVGRDEHVQEAMIKQRFLVSVVDADTVHVTSIAGPGFQARLKHDADTIFAGATFKNVWSLDQERSGYRITQLDLRRIALETVESDSTLSRILRDSLDRLFSSVYRRTVRSLDEFWMDMAKSEQLDIDIARNMLLDSVFFYVGQLGITKQLPKLQDVLTRYDQARKQIAEEEHTAATTGRSVRDTGGTKALKETAKREFVKLLESDHEVQALFLTAIRKKVGDHYQYSPQSVPFELFQNADDATVELNEMLTAADLPPQQEEFVVAWQDNALCFMHWGRPINKFREAGFEQGQERGFDRDLERMLVLNASDKNVLGDGSSVTGKFGLGFKSVFLICDRPRIRSGRLGFEILGGLWPKADLAEDLVEQLRDVRPTLRNGTIIALKDLREPINGDAIVQSVQRFQQLAGILLAFSRKIKSIELRPRDTSPERVEWDERPLNDSATLSIAQIALPPEMARAHVLKIKADQGSLLFKMHHDGFARLPDCVPTIWVTAPTKETSDLGFAISGPFPLDVGRAKLGRDSRESRTLAHAIAGELGRRLCELYDRSRSDWAGLVQALGLSHDLDEYAFWESFWKLCVAPFAAGNRDRDNEACALAKEILWSAPHSGGGHLLRTCAAIPTGLWGDHRMLTKADDIKRTVQGVLEGQTVFEQVSQWEAAAILLEPGHTVSAPHHRVLTQLHVIGPEGVEEVSLRTLLETDVREGTCVATEKAAEFGAVITREFLQSIAGGTTAQKKEHDLLLELLKTYRFHSQDGSVQSAQDLLVPQANETDPCEEGLRAGFAPVNFVLNQDYCDSDAACAFFMACRSRMNAPVDRLKDWALGATTRAQRSAVITYLLKGELGRDLGHELRETKTDTWFEAREQIECFPDLTDNDVHEVCGLLGIRDPEPPPPSPKPEIDPAEALKRIRDWWLSVKDEKASEYDRQIYPDGLIDSLSAKYDSKDKEQRKSWFTLFLLGMTHTMGRTRPEQHRSFVNRCVQKRWLDVFVAKESSAEDWINILDEYIDHPMYSGEFSQWMKLFPNIYRVAKYLDEYVGAFLAVEGLKRTFDLTEITSLPSSPVFQGGGHDAPDLSRTLGMGACFVMRELIRKQILKNSRAHRHCFTPTKEIRDLFQAIQCAELSNVERERNSIYIYNFVVKHLGEEPATFDLSFDVPFHFVAEDVDLQQELLKCELSVAGEESEEDDIALWEIDE